MTKTRNIDEPLALRLNEQISKRVDAGFANVLAEIRSIRSDVRADVTSIRKDMKNLHCVRSDKFESIDTEFDDIKECCTKLETTLDSHTSGTARSGWKAFAFSLGLITIVGSVAFAFSHVSSISEDSRRRVHDFEQKYETVVVPKLTEGAVVYKQLRSDSVGLQKQIDSVEDKVDRNTQLLHLLRVRGEK